MSDSPDYSAPGPDPRAAASRFGGIARSPNADFAISSSADASPTAESALRLPVLAQEVPRSHAAPCAYRPARSASPARGTCGARLRGRVQPPCSKRTSRSISAIDAPIGIFSSRLGVASRIVGGRFATLMSGPGAVSRRLSTTFRSSRARCAPRSPGGRRHPGTGRCSPPATSGWNRAAVRRRG
jgi:hypothetical protein